jgi:hypothetical protein
MKRVLSLSCSSEDHHAHGTPRLWRRLCLCAASVDLRSSGVPISTPNTRRREGRAKRRASAQGCE